MRSFFFTTALTLYSLLSAGQLNMLYTAPREDNKHLYEGKYVKVFIEEKVMIQADVVNDTIRGLHFVQKNHEPLKTFVFSVFTQLINNEQTTCLQVKNPFPKTFRYKVKTATKFQDFKDAPVLDVYPGSKSLEYFPSSVQVVILYELELK